jgi:hypothetical protein
MEMSDGTLRAMALITLLLLRQLNIGQSGEDFFRQARRRVPLILAVSTGSANEA